MRADKSVKSLLGSYPRQRPPLADEYSRQFDKYYLDNRSGKGIANAASQWLESWMHRQVAAVEGGDILETGAGTLNHIAFEPAGSRAAYDIVEPRGFLYENSPYLEKIRDTYESMDAVPDDRRYDSVISIATLEHINDLPRFVARAALLLINNGVFCNAIPSEGSFLWALAWRISTGLSFRIKYGLDYGKVMRHEHLSTAKEIEAVVNYFFRKVSVKHFPTPFFHASIYSLITAKDPDIECCKHFADDQ